MPEPKTPAQQLAEEFAALNEATRRAHEAIADMRAERRLLTEQLAAVRAELHNGVKTILEAQVEAAVSELGKATEKAMRDTVARVDQQIDYYLETALGQDAYSRLKGRPTVPEMVAEARRNGTVVT